MRKGEILFEERRKEQIDPYGLVGKTTYGKVEKINEETPFDSFLLEDSLKFVKYASKLEEFKTNNKSRKNQETGLYEVTVGDYNKEYHVIATMLNRMTNPDYAIKVSRNVMLMRDIICDLKMDTITRLNSMSKSTTSVYDDAIEDILSSIRKGRNL